MPDGQFNEWADQNMLGPNTSSYPNVPTYDEKPYATTAVTTSGGQLASQSASASNHPFATISNQLVKQIPNQQLASRDGSYENDGWLDDGNVGGQTTTWDEGTDEEDLEQKALVAKKDAQAKRKTIPPFVQKLSSFLDESNNTELIRWSDDGNSFIVLDEDEFANTLIPELFKSNKYASFVRQLNMYGFHKKVGLSDNSMRASEKKAKNPSEFYNPFFKRGRPELLWLIHKPKSGTPHPKRKREDGRSKQGGGDSSDEDKKLVAESSGGGQGQLKQSEASSGTQEQQLATLPSSEMSSLRQELQALQRQQRFISKVITQVREQNHQLYQQATAFQALHDRHENSISAILTFLATFYNRNVEGMGAPNLANMFANAIPQTAQHQGTVEDMGEYREGDSNPSHQLTRVAKRPQLLLPPPMAKSATSPGPRVTSKSPDAALLGSRPQNMPGQGASSRTGSTTGHLASTSRQHNVLQEQPLGKNDQPAPLAESDASANDIMALIKNVNASTAASPANDASFHGASSSLDFPEALSQYQSANGNTPLTPKERDDVLALMAKEQQGGANRGVTASSNNALTMPNPPPMPSLDTFATNEQQLDMLQRLQQEQNAKVQSLADRLQPLSPTGSIPGLYNGIAGGNGNGTDLGPPSELDLNSFINNGDYFTGHDQTGVGLGGGVDNESNLFDTSDFGMDFGGPDNSNLGDAGEFDMSAGNNASGFDDAGWPQGLQDENALNPDFDGRGRIESVSSEATSPAATGVADEGIQDDRRTRQTRKQSPSKKRRLG
ncbi:MAG: stress-responsive transcription factor hsf1 [Bathelium mastoideum]|nr:MAG: stress-responsive transcription factor hsf1 [Bathelium mastoideum]